MKKILTILSILLLTVCIAKSQQEPVFSQYTMNQFLINPAFAGSEGYTSFNLTARQQWLGFEGAPMTQAISGQTRISKTSYVSKSRSVKKRIKKRRPSGKIGIGGYLYNDQNGPIGRTGLEISYAYHLFVNDGQLSLGLSLSAYQFRVNTADLVGVDEADPLLGSARESMFIPDGSVGVYYTFLPFYIGLSAKNLFQASVKFGSDNSFGDYQQLRHYYLTTGYKYDMGNDFEIEPSILLKTTELFNLQADVTLKGYYKRDYWLGFSYRTGNAFITMVGVKVDRLYFGYAFDYSLNDIQRISYGSHEIMIGLKFGDNSRRYRWLNRF
ncbi:MAG: type IX secretion system membrane protein PorP/SprF [Bacteroidales bacterium]|jgi:type IX secretion system PorP/SprF family membrane protein|nr:type IX secretion system membrane protein PorP/SprF [Bacteroidales bacterium]